jgi:chemotaxis protein histidine kinase CheA
LKRAQEAPAVKKEEFVASERNEKTRRQEEIFLKDVKLDEPESDKEEEQRQKEEEEAAKQKQVEAEKKQQEEQAKQKEAAEKEAREKRERAKVEAAEAEKALQKEAETRDQRVKASVEAAKKQQAERASGKAAKEAESLYADMPQPNTDDAAATEAAMKEAAAAQKAANLNLPAEDKSKVVFLDVDGVLRPARAGTFDISTDGEAAAKPDTSDFFPEAMKALRHILERTSATIVLCSEWRRSETLLSALSTAFDKNRLRAWSSMTTGALKLQTGPEPLRCFAERRAREISEWLREHEGDVNGWVVLDDINLTIADEARKTTTKAMGPHHVQPMPLCGLTMGNAKIAVRILNGAMINKVVVERPVAPTGGIAPGSGSRGRL